MDADLSTDESDTNDLQRAVVSVMTRQGNKTGKHDQAVHEQAE
jgi:hypothetical protein